MTSRPAEHLLWTLRKGPQQAEARDRMDATGPVLTVYVEGRLLWQQRGAAGDGARLGELAEEERRRMAASGWQIER